MCPDTACKCSESSVRTDGDTPECNGCIEIFTVCGYYERVWSVRSNNKIIIIDNFCIALFSGVHKLIALYNILTNIVNVKCEKK